MQKLNTVLKKPLFTTDRVVGFVIVLFTIFIYTQIKILPNNIAFFPHIVNITIFLLGLALLIKDIIKPISESEEKVFTIMSVTIGVSLIVSYVLLDVLGFFATISILTFLVNVLISPWSIKSLIKGMLFSFFLTLILYVTFNSLMNLITPKGIFF